MKQYYYVRLIAQYVLFTLFRLDNNLSLGYCYLPFELLGPEWTHDTLWDFLFCFVFVFVIDVRVVILRQPMFEHAMCLIFKLSRPGNLFS